MKAVFEEINGDLAVFIVDNIQKIYHLPTAQLPSDIEIGDVFEVEITKDDQLNLLNNLPKERIRREQTARTKREALLKRSQNKKD